MRKRDELFISLCKHMLGISRHKDFWERKILEAEMKGGDKQNG